MSAIDWAAIIGGIPTIIAAITALILALKGNSTAKAANNIANSAASTVQTHLIEHDKLS